MKGIEDLSDISHKLEIEMGLMQYMCERDHISELDWVDRYAKNFESIFSADFEALHTQFLDTNTKDFYEDLSRKLTLFLT